MVLNAYIAHVEYPALKGQGLEDRREGEHNVVEGPHSIHDDLVLVDQAVRAVELRLVQLVTIRGVPAECPHRTLVPGPRVFRAQPVLALVYHPLLRLLRGIPTPLR